MNCIKSSQIVFDQIVDILNKIKDDDYSKPLKIFNGSTIGKHVRHILDFYNCIIAGSDRGELDYCERDRSPSVETSTDFARAGFMELQSELDQLNEEQALTVVTDFHSHGNISRPVVNSSVGRELMYAYDHAVHHLAIIKIGIKSSFSYINIHDHVGVAPSTIKYESSSKAEEH